MGAVHEYKSGRKIKMRMGSTCSSTCGSVANHWTNWKIASLYITNEMALLTLVDAAVSRDSLVESDSWYTR